MTPASSVPDIVASGSTDSAVNHAGYGGHQQIVTISGIHLMWGVVLLIVFASVVYVGWQATIAINLLNNFKSNQFADLKGDVTALRRELDQMHADARAERQADEIARQLKEKPK
jgi:hypothetical protein